MGGRWILNWREGGSLVRVVKREQSWRHSQLIGTLLASCSRTDKPARAFRAHALRDLSTVKTCKQASLGLHGPSLLVRSGPAGREAAETKPLRNEIGGRADGHCTSVDAMLQYAELVNTPAGLFFLYRQ